MQIRKEPDPKLKAAMEEIKSIMAKNDLAGIVILSSADAMEYFLQVEASWSCAKVEKQDANGSFVRVRTTDLSPDQKKKFAEDTVGMFMGLADVMTRLQSSIGGLLEVIGNHFKEVHH